MAGGALARLAGRANDVLLGLVQRSASARSRQPPRGDNSGRPPAGAGRPAGLAHTGPLSQKMIKKFIDKLLGKAPAGKGGKPNFGKRQEVGPQENGIDPTLADERARKGVQTLKERGYEA